MIKFINGILVIAVLVSAFVLYSLEHKTRGLERQIARTNNEIYDGVEDIKLLNAEWSSLTRPDRIQRLTEQSLHLQTLEARQVVQVGELSSKIPSSPEVKLEEQGKDPIGDILKKMQ